MENQGVASQIMIKLDCVPKAPHPTSLDKIISRKYNPVIDSDTNAVSDAMIHIRYKVLDCVETFVRILDRRKL